MRSDKASVDALQQAARALLEERNIPIDASVPWRELAPILVERFDCIEVTAQRHLVKAQRIRRGDDTRQRGGARPGSGPPEGNRNAASTGLALLPKKTIQSATVQSDCPVMVTYVDEDGGISANIGGAGRVTEIIRNGSDRTVRMTFKDGSRITILLFGD